MLVGRRLVCASSSVGPPGALAWPFEPGPVPGGLPGPFSAERSRVSTPLGSSVEACLLPCLFFRNRMASPSPGAPGVRRAANVRVR